MVRKYSKRLEVVHPNCAGIDIGGSVHYVAVDPGRSAQPVRHFATFTDELERMGRWLHECEVEIVAMESTGVYWIPVYEVLDRMGFEVHLVNPRATKQVSGRKSDVLDCQWIWQLMSHGLLNGAFRPPDAVCELRAYVRERARAVRARASSVQHLQKALTQMNVQLTNVLSDVAGERDGARLASYRDARVRADEATIARSLEGTWREEHLFALTQALERYDFHSAQIARCEQRIMATATGMSIQSAEASAGRRRSWEGQMRAPLRAVLGVDLTAIPTIGIETALMVAAEVGPDLSRFPSCAHFCSWLALAPGTRISGGKPLPGRGPAVVNRLGQALRQAATTARSSQSFIGAQHRARLARLDKAKTIKATAHHLARLIYAMLTRGEEYLEKGIAYYESVRRDKQLRALRRNAQRLGTSLVEQPLQSMG